MKSSEGSPRTNGPRLSQAMIYRKTFYKKNKIFSTSSNQRLMHRESRVVTETSRSSLDQIRRRHLALVIQFYRWDEVFVCLFGFIRAQIDSTILIQLKLSEYETMENKFEAFKQNSHWAEMVDHAFRDIRILETRWARLNECHRSTNTHVVYDIDHLGFVVGNSCY